MALEGALRQIAAESGGLVEAISNVTEGRQAQGRFLFSGAVELLEDHAFRRTRQMGKHVRTANKHVSARRGETGRPYCLLKCLLFPSFPRARRGIAMISQSAPSACAGAARARPSGSGPR